MYKCTYTLIVFKHQFEYVNMPTFQQIDISKHEAPTKQLKQRYHLTLITENPPLSSFLP